MEFTIQEIKDIYWALGGYGDIIIEVNPEGHIILKSLQNKIWKQLNNDQKLKIDPDKFSKEKWLEERLKK